MLGLRAAPNPFNPRTTIHLTLLVVARVHREVDHVRGRGVVTLLDEPRGGLGGRPAVAWSGLDDHDFSPLPSGTDRGQGAGWAHVVTARAWLVR